MTLTTPKHLVGNLIRYQMKRSRAPMMQQGQMLITAAVREIILRRDRQL